MGGNYRIQSTRDPEVIQYIMDNMRVAFGRVGDALERLAAGGEFASPNAGRRGRGTTSRRRRSGDSRPRRTRFRRRRRRRGRDEFDNAGHGDCPKAGQAKYPDDYQLLVSAILGRVEQRRARRSGRRRR